MFSLFKRQKVTSSLYPWFDPKWNQRGLYFIPSTTGRVSYFLKRKWGNYLFFPHPETEQFFSSAIARGGIYKVFDNEILFPQMNARLFTKFGAQTVAIEARPRPEFAIEIWNKDYFDIDMKADKGKWCLIIEGQEFTFLEDSSQEHEPNFQLSRQYL